MLVTVWSFVSQFCAPLYPVLNYFSLLQDVHGQGWWLVGCHTHPPRHQMIISTDVNREITSGRNDEFERKGSKSERERTASSVEANTRSRNGVMPPRTPNPRPYSSTRQTNGRGRIPGYEYSSTNQTNYEMGRHIRSTQYGIGLPTSPTHTHTLTKKTSIGQTLGYPPGTSPFD